MSGLFQDRRHASRVFRIGKQLVTIAFWTVLSMILMILVLAACASDAATAVVNSL